MADAPLFIDQPTDHNRNGREPMTKLRLSRTASFGDVGVIAAFGQLVLFVALILSSSASAQNDPVTHYIRSSQPPLLNYRELVTLSEQETVESALADKLHVLLTTPFVNNEAYFSGTRPIRPDLNGAGPSLRLVQWNMERGLELDQIKLLMTDKAGFLAKVHSEIASGKGKDRPTDEELSQQIGVLQSADVIVLNELDWGMKRTNYQAV